MEPKFKVGDVIYHHDFINNEKDPYFQLRKVIAIDIDELIYTVEAIESKLNPEYIVQKPDFNSLEPRFVLAQPYLNEQRMKRELGIE